MARYASTTVTDEGTPGIPLAGTIVTITASSGQLAVLTDDNGGPLSNPVTIGSLGVLEFNIPDPGDVLLMQYRYGNRLLREDSTLVGRPSPLIGPTGAAANTFTSLALLKALDHNIYPSSILADGTNPPINYAYVTGDFTGQDDEVNVVKLNAVAINVGALVRQQATGIGYQRTTQTLQRSVSDKLAELPLSALDTPNLIADGRDNTTALQALLNAGAGSVVRITRATWLVSGPLIVPAGTTVLIDDYTTIRWTGATLTAGFTGIFNVSAGTIRIVVNGRGYALFASTTAQPFLYAAAGQDCADVELAGLSASNMGAYFFTSSQGGNAANVVTPAMKSANPSLTLSVCQRLRIRDCGSTFLAQQTTGQGQCYVGFAYDVQIDGGWATGGTQGLELWGGNANPAVDGAVATERKLQNARVNGFKTDTVGGGGIFTSMGYQVVLTSCVVANCGDVGIDFEGCQDSRAVLCSSSNCPNGAYSTFFYGRGIQIVECNASQINKSYPLYRNYSLVSDPNSKDLTIRGGKWLCTDTTGPGSIDLGNTPLTQINMSGAKLINVLPYLSAAGINQVNLSDIDITLPYPFTGDIVVIDGANLADNMKPWIHISGLTINGAGTFGATTNLLRITNPSSNAPASYVIENVTGSVYRGPGNGDAGIALIDNNQNTIASYFSVNGCRFDGRITTHNTTGLGTPTFPTTSADNRHLDGTNMPVVAV